MRLFVGPRFSQLLCNPESIGISRHIEVQDLTPVVTNDEKAIQNTKRERWDCEEVHRSDCLAMIPEERQPSLRGIWISRGSPNPSRDTPFRQIETQLEQFAVNARRYPGRILGNHTKDQAANLFADTYQRYSLYLMAMGQIQDSFARIEKARELDPLSISINFSLGWRLYMARQYDHAIEQLRNTLEMDPSYELAHLVVGQAYEEKGEYALAIPELRKAVELSHGTPLMISALAHAYARSGNRTEAEKLLAELVTESNKQYVSPYYFAVVYAGLGKNEQAINWLEKAFADRSNGLVFMRMEPELDGLRSNPRFIALQQKLNLPR